MFFATLLIFVCVQSSGDGVTANSLEPSDPSVRNIAGEGFQKIDKCSQNPLRSVVELHVGNEKLVDSAKLDMVVLLSSIPPYLSFQ